MLFTVIRSNINVHVYLTGLTGDRADVVSCLFVQASLPSPSPWPWQSSLTPKHHWQAHLYLIRWDLPVSWSKTVACIRYSNDPLAKHCLSYWYSNFYTVQPLLVFDTVTSLSCLWASSRLRNALFLQLCQFVFHLSSALLPCLRSFLLGVLRNPSYAANGYVNLSC